MRTALKTVLLLNRGKSEDNVPAPRRFMLFIDGFIDGENLVFRYQAMLEEGYISHPCKPQGNTHYLPDTYLWSAAISVPWNSNSELVRANYYTSVCGDSEKLEEVADSIKGILKNAPQGVTCLFPTVMKKSRKREKAKGVDIQMVVDILSNVYQNTIDTVCIFSGDGDFAPVLDEVRHAGKRVILFAFSSGFSRLLRHKADEVLFLDNMFFRPLEASI